MKRSRLSSFFIYVFLVLALICTLYPFVWALYSSFKPAEEFMKCQPYELPHQPTLENYNSLLHSDFPLYFKNSFIVAVITVSCITLLGPMAAYPLTKMQFKGRTVITKVFMTGIMIPLTVSIVPMYNLFSKLGLRNTYWALIIPQIGFSIPTSMFLCMGFLGSLPDSLIEAAYIDGASSFHLFLKVVLPLLKTTLITVATQSSVFVWNEYTYANTFISKKAMRTLPIGLNEFVDYHGYRNWGGTLAAICISILPVMLLYFILSKRVMEGMIAGAVKN